MVLIQPLDPLPVLAEYSSDEKRICELQMGFATRLRKSAYYVVETTKSAELPRYSDKYRPSPASQPSLKRKDLHQPFFPSDIFEGYFNPKKKRQGIWEFSSAQATKSKGKGNLMNLDEMQEDGDDAEKSSDERSDAGSQVVESDYDVDEEYDNDYAENYFDNGEGDDMDDLGGGGGGDDGGGETMKSTLVSLVLLGAAPVAVSACEGQCIIGITDAFLGNYSTPIGSVLGRLVCRKLSLYTPSNSSSKANQISNELIPPESRTSTPFKYLTPLIDTYNKLAYNAMETAIFPSYFHGKCQDAPGANGVEPKGCPDPDCPVVCGTPGSLIHFYSKLRTIAFDETISMLKNLTNPESDSFKGVAKAVMADIDGNSSRGGIVTPGRVGVPLLRRTENVTMALERIMKQAPILLDKTCGEGQAECSWEVAMKEYIMSFP
ncbi:hypothetical protein HWV62_42635 [Athelia sp. TMB]|nr:hypothetical protein HWV62_42635 [Athelia sp. TMB]